MSYTPVLIITHLTALDGLLKNAQKNGTYAGNEKHWDDEVLKILNKDCTQAEYNVRINAETIEQQRILAKGIIDGAEASLKKKVLTQGDSDLINDAPASIAKCADRMDSDTGDLTHANVEYRGGWPAVARDILSVKTLLDPFLATRLKGIDASRENVNKKKRCEEYVERAKEFVKQAKQRQNEGRVEVDSFRADIDEIVAKAEKTRDDIKSAHFKKKNSIDVLKKLAATKVWTPDQKKTSQSTMGIVVADAKNARGMLKTIETLVDGLEKRGKASGPGWKDMAAKAVKLAQKPLSEAKAASKEFDADEEKCRKICKEHGVNV